jgi:hypothetical protein
VAADTPDSLEGFEAWLLRRVAQAVEAGDVSVELLTELQAEFAAAQERPQDEAQSAAIQHLADLAGVAEEEARSVLEGIEAQPTVTRELLLRRFAEAWLEGQCKEERNRRSH